MHEWTDRQGRKRRLYCLEGTVTPLQYEHERRGQWRPAAMAEPLMDELLRLAEEIEKLRGAVGPLVAECIDSVSTDEVLTPGDLFRLLMRIGLIEEIDGPGGKTWAPSHLAGTILAHD